MVVVSGALACTVAGLLGGDRRPVIDWRAVQLCCEDDKPAVQSALCGQKGRA